MPASEAAIQALVRQASAEGLGVRVAGTGHSFTPLVATDGVLVSLDAYAGVVAHDLGRTEATVRSGTKLTALGGELRALGLAMENLGDVDVQSLGGATGTGTHGTGPTFGNLSSQITRLRLVTADGGIVTCDAESDPEAYLAARVSLGMLGIVSTLTLRLLPAYRLHERTRQIPWARCAEEMAAEIAVNEHFEFFWYPSTDACACKTLNATALDPEEWAGAEGERLGWSAEIIPSVRSRRFNEMEYAIPAERGPACFAEVRALLRTRHPDVVWPVEYRTLAADDAFLSPAYARATVTISVHQDALLPYREFFAEVEAVFRAHEGRPHWGKHHTRTHAELRALYPAWERFIAVRRRMDPEGRFLNDYLRGLFEDG